MKYQITISPTAKRQFKGLPRKTQLNLRNAIYVLSDEPRPTGCKKLHSNKNLWRIRIGDYRIVYQINDNELIIQPSQNL